MHTRTHTYDALTTHTNAHTRKKQDAASAADTLVNSAREIWETMVEGPQDAIDDISAIVVFLP